MFKTYLKIISENDNFFEEVGLLNVMEVNNIIKSYKLKEKNYKIKIVTINTKNDEEKTLRSF
ncbi:MAG: hypothetical protein ACOCQD_04050 [archaeon]